MNTLPHFRRLSLFLLGCALLLGSPTPIPAEAQDRPTTLFLVRHAEKSAPNGDVPLSAEGRSRAALLASMLRDTGVGRIFTTEMVRTRETAEPLERGLGLKAEAVPVQDVEALVSRLRALAPGSVALVVNHSGTIPKIVEKLGGGIIKPIAEDEYDRLLILTLAPDGKAHAVVLRFGSKLE
jgi:phosphohistidine phosphatase SixA